MPGTIRVQASSANPLVVNFTRQDGTAASCYSNYGLTTPVSLPATISADTSFYFPAPDTIVISAKVGGSEIASSSGTTVTQFLPDGRVLVFAPSIDAIERTAYESGTYPPAVVVPVVGDGATDDAAAINAKLVANAGRVVVPAGSTGVVIVGATIVIQTGCTLEINHGVTLRRKTGFTGNLIQNAGVGTGVRDTNVGLLLGQASMIDGGDNSGSSGSGLHHLRFRKVDGLTVRGPVTSTLKTTGGKYAVSIADCTRLDVGGWTNNTSSDGVHIAGPVASGTISHLFGYCGDDMVAVTPRDWTAYDDSNGAVSDLTIEDIIPTATNGCAVKVLGGDPTTSAKRIKVRNVLGSAVAGGLAAVQIGDDPAQANTIGGLLDDITVENLSTVVTTNSKPVLVLNGTNMKRISVDGVHYDNASGSISPIRVTPSASSTIAALRFRRIDVPGVGSGQAVFDLNSNSTITVLSVDGLTLVSSTTVAGIVFAGGTITDLLIRGVSVNAAAAVTVLALSGAAATVTRATISDVHHVATGGSLVAATTSTQTLPSVELSNVTLSGTAWLFDTNVTTVAHCSGVSKTGGSGIANIRASAVLTLSGDGNALAGGFTIAAGGKVAVRAIDCPPTANAGGVPTVAAGAGAGTSPTVAIAGTDRTGSFTLTAGTTPSAGAVVTITFIGTWPQTPKIVLTPTNAAAQAAGLYVSAKSTTAFTVSAANAPGSVTFDYAVLA